MLYYLIYLKLSFANFFLLVDKKTRNSAIDQVDFESNTSS